jgi:diguanylate cyclase (GGDEF)-like protein
LSQSGEEALDHLTGLLPRSGLELAADRFAGRSAGGTWSLIMLDLDGFKLLNDVFGHSAGDAALRRLGEILRSQVRSGDMAIRYGGDEIAVVMPDTGGPGALDLCNRLRDEIRRRRLNETLELTVSAGIASSREGERDLRELLRRADRALLSAKDSGKDRVFFYSSEMEQTSRPEVVFGHFVGRRPDLRRLRGLLRESLESGLRLAMVTGEEGLGKTRLISELEHYAEFRGARTLYSPSVGTAGAHPYSVALGPVSRALELLEPADLQELRGAVEPLHPALLELLPMLEPASTRDRGFFGAEGARYRIFEDISGVLRALALKTRLLLVYEDLQLMPAPDLDLVLYCARALCDSRMMIVLSADVSSAGRRTVERIARLDPRPPVARIRLKRLSRRDTFNLVLFTLRDPGVPEELMDMLYRSSGGNPLFLREILSSMVSRGEIGLGNGGRGYSVPETIRLPDNLTQIIRRRLAERSPETVELLEVASLTEGGFSLDLLEAATGEEPLTLASRLEPALRTGLLAEREDSRGRPVYDFSYDAVRQLLRDRVGRNLSMLYHRRIADWLSERMESGDEALTGRVALHYLEAGEKSRAASVSFEAGMRAVGHAASRQAVGWLERYLSAAPDGEPPKRRVTAMRELGRLYSSSGRVEKGQEMLLGALDAAGPAQRPSVLAELGENLYKQSRYPEALEAFGELLESDADAALRVRALMRRAFIETLEAAWQDAGADLERGLEIIGEMEPGPRRESMTALYHTRKGDLVSMVRADMSAEDHYSRALQIYREHGDRLGEATVLNNMSELYGRRGDYAGDIRLLQRVEEINRRNDDALGLAIASYNLAEAHAVIGRHAMAREYYQRYLDLSGRIENRLGLAYGRLGLGRLETAQGRYDLAADYLEDAVELFGSLGSAGLQAEARLSLVEALIRGGRASEAGGELERMRERNVRADQRSTLHYLRGLLLLEQAGGGGGGPASAAITELRRSVEDGEGLQIPVLAQRWQTLIEAEELLDEGDAGAARERAGSCLSEMLDRVPSEESRRMLAGLPEVSRLLPST